MQVGTISNKVCSVAGQIGTITSDSVSCLCACTTGGDRESMVDDENGTCKAICNTNNSKVVSCTGKPDNSIYHSAAAITQTRNGGGWTPSAIASYNTTASTSECRFTCESGYTRNGTTCIPLNCAASYQCFTKPGGGFSEGELVG